MRYLTDFFLFFIFIATTTKDDRTHHLLFLNEILFSEQSKIIPNAYKRKIGILTLPLWDSIK